MKENHTRLVLLTGAGASKPLGFPVMTEFLDTDFWHAGDGAQQAVAFLGYQWSRANVSEQPDFEYVYTLAHLLADLRADDPMAFALTGASQVELRLPPNKQIRLQLDTIKEGARKLREQLREDVHNKLTEFDQARAAALYGDFLRPLLAGLQEPPRLSIFTTNYDRVIESIWASGQHVSVFGRPVELRRGFSVVNAYQSGLAWNPSDYDSTGSPSDGTIRLFKLHGSLNWRRVGSSLVETEANEYAARSLLIYPLRGTKSFLDEPFQTLFQHWRSEIAAATDCIVIGASMRDPHVLDPIERAANERSTFRLWIVDPAADNLKSRLPEAVKARSISVPVRFGDPSVGNEIAFRLFDPSLRLNVERVMVGETSPK